ncbi:MAG: nickel/cobalt efflux transporter RcnA [Candidatus Omnitrophica bacterium]|nr:nickel/cobalt efflux transporter RcnA [Candidatus Omnitrophota bacterium]
MYSFNEYIAQGHAWLFFPMAVLLGALHGLEPGHSKTMMTAYIVAISGTVWQAFLLGISATISHTAVIWILAFVGMYYGSNLDIETLEPYFQVATGIMVIGLAVWMLYRTRQAQKEVEGHAHSHDADHHHHEESPHSAELEFGDAHERAHAAQLQKQLMNQKVTTGQVILFGLSGGLLPCPSAFAVLLVCLQLKKMTLGFAMVLAFSLGLAITLVTVGTIAAFSVKHVSKKFKRFGEFARKLPYASSAILILIGLMVVIQGMRHLIN